MREIYCYHHLATWKLLIDAKPAEDVANIKKAITEAMADGIVEDLLIQQTQ